MTQPLPTSSPWGPVQYGHELADGIVTVSTAGHGGIRISPERLKQMPRALRVGRQRWFEEDCEASLVLWAFAGDIGLTAEQTAQVETSVRDWFPEKWEAHIGKVLEPGQSLQRDEQNFKQETSGRFVVGGAAGSWHDDVPDGKVGCWATRASDGAKANFLVDKARYDQRGRFGYIIDEAIDAPWETAA